MESLLSAHLPFALCRPECTGSVLAMSVWTVTCSIPEPAIRFAVMCTAAATGKLSAGDDTQVLSGLRGGKSQQSTLRQQGTCYKEFVAAIDARDRSDDPIEGIEPKSREEVHMNGTLG